MASSPTRSLHARVALLLLLLLGGVSVAFSVAGWYYARLTAGGAFDALLSAGAAQIAENTYQQGGVVTVDLPVSVLAGLSVNDNAAYKVVDWRGVVVAGADDLEAPIDAVALGNGMLVNGPVLRDASWRGQPVRTAVTARRLAGGWVTVTLAQTLNARTALAHDIAAKAVAAVLVLDGLALIVTLVAVRRVLAPLTAVQRVLQDRDSRDLSPLAVEAPPEIAQLVGAINGFMVRLDERIGLMQRLIGDAAHQLRTPLAALSSQVDLLTVERDPARRDAQLSRIAARTEQLGHLLGQLFNHAMVTHRTGVAPFEPVDLVLLTRRVLLDVPPAARTLEMSFDAPSKPVIIPGDAISLREAISNVVGNALRHGARSRLEVRVLRDAVGSRVEVLDDGPGIPPALWSRVREPFHGRDDGQPGAGLGLAIADEVVRAHGGELRFSSHSDEGFAVILAFPPAA